ncbi:TolC family protein [uncultured Duncaniella sp.]|uniref:TolC family protein n=3 Tax=uncultured Duncaniella sp. TaxID=2768039 RepID=UPI000F4899D6|nr:TolC family protein [uncultured Duncaniella sp.]ROS86528.1 TolC family protein [Muribaculaceae bacterium Isolate-080 (Janvier)]
MKRIIYSLLLTVGISQTVMADAWSLDSCVNYALSHNLNIKNAEISRMQSELSVTEAKDGFLPQLSAGAGQNWSFGRGLTSANTYANRNTSSFSWNVQMSLPIFQGLRNIRQLRYAQSSLSMAEMQAEASRDEVRLNVITSYLQVLFNKEILEVSREQLRLSNVQLERQQALLEGGKVPEVDVIQAKAQVAQNEVQVVNSENDYTTSIIELAKLLELDNLTGFDVMPIDDDTMTLLNAEEVYRNALSNYPAISAARQAIKVADDGITLAKSGYLPTLSFNAGLGSSYYTVSGDDTKKFSSQMRDNFSKNLGFSLNIPIFDAFSTRNQIRQAKVRKLSAQIQLEQQQSELHRAIRLAYQQAVGAEKKYEAGKIAVDASKAALDAMTEKYTYGKANATEWEQTQSDYITTLAQQVQAKYELILRNKVLQFYNRQ